MSATPGNAVPAEAASTRPKGQSIQALIISGLEGEAPPRGLAPVIEAVRTYWKLIAICACFGALVGTAAWWIWPKSYQAQVTLSPADMAGMSGGLQSLLGQYSSLAGMIGVDLGSDHATDTSIALMQSRQFLESFVAAHGLLPVLFPKAWNPATKNWKRPNEGEHPTLQDGYGYFIKHVLTVYQDKKTGLLTVTIEWKDPVVAAFWANDLVDRINKLSREMASKQATDSIQFLYDQLRTAESVGLQMAINSLIQSELNKKMLANSRPDYAFSVIDPAEAPDLRNYSWPQAIPLIAAGVLLGLMGGLGIGLLKRSRRLAELVVPVRPHG